MSHNMHNVNAGALIYSQKTKRFLFLLRNASKRFKGTWGIVGGHINHNERPIEGLWREIKEETSIDLSYTKVIPLETFTNEEQDFLYHTFVVLVEDEFIPILNIEHRGYAWVDLADYPTPMHPGVWKTVNFKSVIDKIETIKSIFTI